MLSLGKSLLSVSFQPVLTCLTQNKIQTEADDCVRKLSTLSFPGNFRACYFSEFFPGHVFLRKQSGQYRGLQLRATWDPLFTNSTHPSASIDHLWLSFTFSFPFHVFFISCSCQIFPTSPMSLISTAMRTSAYVLAHSFWEAELGCFMAAARALGKRFETTQLSRCAVAAGECCSQQLFQLQSLPTSEQQQQHCSITVVDPTTGLLLPSQKQFLISCRSASLFYFINYRLSCDSFHMPALGVMVHEKSH